MNAATQSPEQAPSRLAVRWRAFVDCVRMDGASWAHRASLIALVGACLIWIAAALFGIDGPLQWGHYGHLQGEYVMRARGTLRFHTNIPAHWCGVTFPPPGSYYLHHPILPHQFLALAMRVLGEHVWLPRAIPACFGLLALVALFVLARRHWGYLAASATALVFATLPYCWSFNILYFEGWFGLAGFIIALDAYLRFRERPSTGLAAIAISGFFLGGLCEWGPYLHTAFFVPAALLIGLSRQDRSFRPLLGLRPSQWLALLIGGAMALALGFHFYFTYKAGALDDLFGAYSSRSGGSSSSDFTKERQLSWIDLFYGRRYLWLSGVWLGLLILKLFSRRARARDLAILLPLASWAAYARLLPMTVNTHNFHVLPLTMAFSLMIGSLVTDVPAIAATGLAWFRAPKPLARTVFASLGLVFAGWWLWRQVPDAIDSIQIARVKAGTHEIANYDPRRVQFEFAKECRLHTPPDAFVWVSTNLEVRPEFMSLIDRQTEWAWALVDAPYAGRPTFMAWDNEGLGGADRDHADRLMAAHPVFMVDSYVLVNLSEDNPGLESMVTSYAKPSLAYRYFKSWTYEPIVLADGISDAKALWAGNLGIPVRSHAEPEFPADDPVKLVNYLDFQRARGADQSRIAPAERRLSELFSAGHSLPALSIDYWGLRPGTRRLFVTFAPTQAVFTQDIRIALQRIGKMPVVLPPSSPAKPAKSAKLAKPDPGPISRIPVPSTPESQVGLWKPSVIYPWELGLEDLPAGEYQVSVELFDRGKGIIVTPPSAHPLPVLGPTPPPGHTGHSRRVNREKAALAKPVPEPPVPAPVPPPIMITPAARVVLGNIVLK